MKRVTGIGGIFFKAENPKKLYEWYDKHLGIKSDPNQGAMLHWREDENPDRRGMTVWAIFKNDTKYFEPSRAPFMLNYRVDDMDGLLQALKAGERPAADHQLRRSCGSGGEQSAASSGLAGFSRQHFRIDPYLARRVRPHWRTASLGPEHWQARLAAQFQDNALGAATSHGREYSLRRRHSGSSVQGI